MTNIAFNLNQSLDSSVAWRSPKQLKGKITPTQFRWKCTRSLLIASISEAPTMW